MQILLVVVMEQPEWWVLQAVLTSAVLFTHCTKLANRVRVVTEAVLRPRRTFCMNVHRMGYTERALQYESSQEHPFLA